MPAVTEPEEGELRESEEGPTTPADKERQEGSGLAVLVLARAEVEPGEAVSEGPDPVPQEDGGHLQQPAEQAVLDPAEAGVARLGGEVGLG